MNLTVARAVRTLLCHPHRRWAVIIGTCLTAVVTVLPAVDEYSATCQRVEELRQQLQQALDAANRLADLERQLTQWKAVLAEHESRAMTDDRVSQFRNDLVSLARRCGCQLRRVRVDEPREREWTQGDDPLAARPVSDRADKTPFVLRSRRFSVSVTGKLSGITEFLADLSQQRLLVHSSAMTLQKSNEDEEFVVLELELMMFELTRSKRLTSA